MMHGFLQTDSINIQRRRLRESISRVNPVSVAQRRTKTTKRRKYLVPMVKSPWHMDGHMKLIRQVIFVLVVSVHTGQLLTESGM